MAVYWASRAPFWCPLGARAERFMLWRGVFLSDPVRQHAIRRGNAR